MHHLGHEGGRVHRFLTRLDTGLLATFVRMFTVYFLHDLIIHVISRCFHPSIAGRRLSVFARPWPRQSDWRGDRVGRPRDTAGGPDREEGGKGEGGPHSARERERRSQG